MKKIEIELTDQQEQFLKLFAEKQYPGADDNVCTCNAIHAVETYRPHYIPYHEDQTDYFDHLPLKFTTDYDYEVWHNSEVEAVQDWFEGREEGPPFEIKPLSEMEYETFEVNDDEIFVMNYSDYFKVYGIEWYAASWIQENYEPVAFFFILDEAKRYIKYQGHNLTKPRTYTYSSGYSNNGDFNHFRDLLLNMGDKLNKDDNNEKGDNDENSKNT
ncbi:hypothetical protein [Paenibacillus tianjinensis]|uniref:YubB ferredoxin-like domain-containing protein n=1 Tax=Paenibacillus tianjinensis TaxID=2810347 RepID=A0ABX7L5P1_9BACL|nr:hypothetical protein [Paenibacillus tianjinensis]QSF43415.1 hypothetical protein JRJ22_19315 [Paenibacillus tianjinensis]